MSRYRMHLVIEGEVWRKDNVTVAENEVDAVNADLNVFKRALRLNIKAAPEHHVLGNVPEDATDIMKMVNGCWFTGWPGDKCEAATFMAPHHTGPVGVAMGPKCQCHHHTCPMEIAAAEAGKRFGVVNRRYFLE